MYNVQAGGELNGVAKKMGGNLAGVVLTFIILTCFWNTSVLTVH